jgi:hypothetical protein
VLLVQLVQFWGGIIQIKIVSEISPISTVSPVSVIIQLVYLVQFSTIQFLRGYNKN